MSEDNQHPPRKPPDRRKRTALLDQAITRRDLSNPEQSVVLAPGALRYRPIQASAAIEAAPSAPADRGFHDSGTEAPHRAEPDRPGGRRAIRPRPTDSSPEEVLPRHDDKRQKVLPLASPPLVSTPTSTRIPTQRRASTTAAAVVRLPQPDSPSPSPSPSSPPTKYLALPAPSEFQVSIDSAVPSGSEEDDERFSDADSVDSAEPGSSVPLDLPLATPPTPTPRAAAAYAAHLACFDTPLPRRPPTPECAATDPPAEAPAADRLFAAVASAASRPRTPVAADAPATVAQPDAQPPTSTKGYPPIVVECLPNWTVHFAAIRGQLGHAPNARPLGKGVRFIPRSPEEYRVVQRYLVGAMAEDPAISWFCYSVQADLPTKVAIRGLPADTDPEVIKAALLELDFPARFVRHISTKQGRAGCLFHAQLDHMTQDGLTKLYRVNELLSMPGVTIEHWRGAANRVPQCHRCQAFGHASANCHRPQRCVRCGGQHFAADCPRELTAKPTCANCARDHTANDRRCPVFRREARKRGIRVPPPLPPPPVAADAAQRRAAQPPPTMRTEPAPSSATRGRAVSPPARTDGRSHAPSRRTAVHPAPLPRHETVPFAEANPPTERGQVLRGKRKKRRGGKGKRKPMASSTPLQPPSQPAPPPSQTIPPSAPSVAATRLAPFPAYQLPIPELAVARDSANPHPPPRPSLIPSVLQAPAAQWVPLPPRARPGPRPRLAPQASALQASAPPTDNLPVAQATATTTAGRAGNPLETILGVLTEFLVTIAAGGNLQEAAVRALATLNSNQYG